MSPSKNTVPVGRQAPVNSTTESPVTNKFELIIYSIDGHRSIHPLREEVTSVGRARDNDVVVDDRRVSGHHCEFRKFGEEAFEVVDLESYNGTTVNRIQVERATVRISDQIALGQVDVAIVPAGKSQDEVAAEEAEEFRKEQREFAKQNKQLEDDRRALAKEAKALKKDKEKWKANESALAQEREKFKDETRKLRQEQEAQEESRKEFEMEKVALRKELEGLKSEIEDRKNERAELQKSIVAAEENLKQTTKELGGLSSNLATERAALDGLNSTIAELNGEKIRTADEVAKLREELPQLKAERDALETQTHELQHRIETGKVEVETLEQAARDAQALSAAALATQRQIDIALGKKRDQLAFFENRLAITREERDQMEEETREYRIFMGGYERRKTELEQKIQQLEARLVG